MAAYWGRMDHAWGARSDAHNNLPNSPSSYLRRVYFDACVYTPGQLKHLVDTFGADHILMGTDYPYDMADANRVGLVMSAGFDEATTAAIVGGNASKLLSI